MELHFPHLSNGMTTSKTVKKQSKLLPISVAMVIIMLIGYISF